MRVISSGGSPLLIYIIRPKTWFHSNVKKIQSPSFWCIHFKLCLTSTRKTKLFWSSHIYPYDLRNNPGQRFGFWYLLTYECNPVLIQLPLTQLSILLLAKKCNSLSALRLHLYGSIFNIGPIFSCRREIFSSFFYMQPICLSGKKYMDLKCICMNAA